jgi:ATPase subunit of ABC transporter with duplicated ATPase domains
MIMMRDAYISQMEEKARQGEEAAEEQHKKVEREAQRIQREGQKIQCTKDQGAREAFRQWWIADSIHEAGEELQRQVNR